MFENSWRRLWLFKSFCFASRHYWPDFCCAPVALLRAWKQRETQRHLPKPDSCCNWSFAFSWRTFLEFPIHDLPEMHGTCPKLYLPMTKSWLISLKHLPVSQIICHDPIVSPSFPHGKTSSTWHQHFPWGWLVNPSPSKARLRRSPDPVLAAPRYNSSSAASARRANAWRRWWGRGSPGGSEGTTLDRKDGHLRWGSRLDGNARESRHNLWVFTAPFNHDAFSGNFVSSILIGFLDSIPFGDVLTIHPVKR